MMPILYQMAGLASTKVEGDEAKIIEALAVEAEKCLLGGVGHDERDWLCMDPLSREAWTLAGQRIRLRQSLQTAEMMLDKVKQLEALGQLDAEAQADEGCELALLAFLERYDERRSA